MERTGAPRAATRRVQRLACAGDKARTEFDRAPRAVESRAQLRPAVEQLTELARSVAEEISRLPGHGGALGVKFIRIHARAGARAVSLYDKAMSTAKEESTAKTAPVASRKNKLTGEPVELYDAEARGSRFAPEGGRWVTYCVAHGTHGNHRTKASALLEMATLAWCDECMARVAALIEVE